ncbi:MAG: glutathione S-transferase N-terminal domain-containing protein [Pseudomonadota bacterium]
MTSIANRRSVMTLFSNPACPFSHRVRVVLCEKDISVEIESVDPDNLPEDLLFLNPYSSVPTLLDRDLVLYDSRVISEYLDERFPHPPLMPVDPVSRARSRLALYRVENDWYSLLPALEGGDKRKKERARTRLQESLVASAEVFAAKPFFLSDEFTLVDATIAPVLWRLEEYEVELPKEAAAVKKYADSIFARDGFQLSLTEEEREMR